MKRIIFSFARLVPMQHPLRIFLRRMYIKCKASRQMIDQDCARANLADTLNVLNAIGVKKWWLEAGTCLGAIREGKFISHDFDIDIGLMAQDVGIVSQLSEEMLKNGFENYNSNQGGTPEYGYEISFIRNGINVDFFFFYEEGDTLWHGAWSSEGIHKHVFSKELFDELKPLDFLGLNVYTPNPPEKYLEERYGDWRTPKKDWDWKVDPLCVKK